MKDKKPGEWSDNELQIQIGRLKFSVELDKEEKGTPTGPSTPNSVRGTVGDSDEGMRKHKEPNG